MRHIRLILACVTGLGMTLGNACAEESGLAAGGAPSGTVTDKTGGLYPNDFGPAEIDVSAYPKEQRLAYKVFAFKCQACHTIARPINSQFLELTAAEIAKAQRDEPELLSDPKVLKSDPDIWRRYVKRMMGKAGCPVKPADGKQIWAFLVYDSKVRKTGANAAAWREHRKHLLHEFQEHYGEVYEQLFPKPAK